MITMMRVTILPYNPNTQLWFHYSDEPAGDLWVTDMYQFFELLCIAGIAGYSQVVVVWLWLWCSVDAPVCCAMDGHTNIFSPICWAEIIDEHGHTHLSVRVLLVYCTNMVVSATIILSWGCVVRILSIRDLLWYMRVVMIGWLRIFPIIRVFRGRRRKRDEDNVDGYPMRS